MATSWTTTYSLKSLMSPKFWIAHVKHNCRHSLLNSVLPTGTKELSPMRHCQTKPQDVFDIEHVRHCPHLHVNESPHKKRMRARFSLNPGSRGIQPSLAKTRHSCIADDDRASTILKPQSIFFLLNLSICWTSTSAYPVAASRLYTTTEYVGITLWWPGGGRHWSWWWTGQGMCRTATALVASLAAVLVSIKRLRRDASWQ